MVTSSAVVGSSAISSAGTAGERHGDHHALAHAARELVRIVLRARCGGSGMSHQRAASRRPAPSACFAGRSAGAAAAPRRSGRRSSCTGLSEVIGSWKIIEMRLPRMSRICCFVAASGDRGRRAGPRRRRCGRAGRHQPHDRQRGDALAAAGFADDRQGLAAADAEGDVVDGAEQAEAVKKTVCRPVTSSTVSCVVVPISCAAADRACRAARRPAGWCRTRQG